MTAYSFKKQFVVPIKLGLGMSYAIDDIAGIKAGPKLQTIRAISKRHHAKVGGELQLYTGMRTKKCELIGRARCTAVERIIIWTSTMAIMVSGKLLTAHAIVAFAKSDGFASVHDMHQFWNDNHPGVDKFEGVLIRWEPLK